MTSVPEAAESEGSSQRNTAKSRWVVLVAASIVYASFGFVVAVTAALVSPIREDLGLSAAQMGLVLGAWQFSYIGMSIPAGRAVDRFGARQAMAVAGTVVVASAVGRAWAPGFLTLLLGAGALGLGAPLISVGVPAVAASLFTGRARRRAVAVYSTSPAFGSILGLFLPGSVLLPLFHNEWRLVALVAAVVAGLALAVWIWASRSLDEVMVPGSGPALSDYLDIARLPVVRTILILAALTFFVMHGVGQWMVVIIESSGRSPADAGRWATFAAATVLLVGVTVPQLASPRLRPAMLVGAALTGAVALQGIDAAEPLRLGFSLVGVSWARAGMVPLFVLMLMDSPEVGSARTAAATGLFFTVAQFGGVAGPALTGLMADISADRPSFDSALTMHSAVLILLAVVVAVGFGPRLLASHSQEAPKDG